ncbi:uncharacterized protein LOC108246786 isoform X2 [Kryptolebias marmoratus]|uniref:uncharacterized protein LOC108246786 isoform X2 n=1 Tax=Kryptolebias marmoratus TaxID=37003 RepID=UPI000D530AE9|nr:uncharacterized protein LOC108246786 isoform X2 [Kryptolebias marmoratus]
MGRCRLWLVFLLRLVFCSFNKAAGIQEQVVKTVGKEADITLVCPDATLNITILIFCKVRPERSRKEECQLRYRREQGFDHECDSRFSLVTINQTVFLQLNNLSPENSGNYSCHCSYKGGTYTLLLNITVEDSLENEDSINATRTALAVAEIAIIAVPVLFVIVTTGAILGVVCKKICHRRRDVTLEVETIEPYSTFLQRENGLYLTSMIHTSTSTNNLNMSGADNASLGAPL